MYLGSRMYDGLARFRDAGFDPKSILDVGAYNGDWARGARQLFPTAYILMVDALAEREEGIRRTAAEIGNANYRLALIGDKDQPESNFFVVNSVHGQTGSSRYRESAAQSVAERQMRQLTAATLTMEAGRPFDFVKLDVQGSELDVLQGWGTSLDQVQVVLMEISVVQYNLGSPLAQRVFAEMAQLGFILYDIVDEMRQGGERDYLMQFDGLFVRGDSPLLPKPPF